MARGGFCAAYRSASNVSALVMQSLVVGWLTVRGGVRAPLAAMWLLCALSFAAPAIDFEWREILFSLLSPETKFERKSLFDTALHRGADTLANGVYLLVASLGLAGIAGASASACVLLIVVVRWLGAAFTEQESKGLRSR
jgi:hypothetical protein